MERDDGDGRIPLRLCSGVPFEAEIYAHYTTLPVRRRGEYLRELLSLGVDSWKQGAPAPSVSWNALLERKGDWSSAETPIQLQLTREVGFETEILDRYVSLPRNRRMEFVRELLGRGLALQKAGQSASSRWAVQQEPASSPPMTARASASAEAGAVVPSLAHSASSSTQASAPIVRRLDAGSSAQQAVLQASQVSPLGDVASNLSSVTPRSEVVAEQERPRAAKAMLSGFLKQASGRT